MKVWNIRTKWDGENIFPIFKQHKIAFAWTLDQYLPSIKQGDLFAISDGQTITGIGQVNVFEDLKNFNLNYVAKFGDIKCVTFSKFFSKDNYPAIAFGNYGGQLQLHQAQGEYPKRIIKLYNQLNGLAMLTELKELLKYKHQIILQGPPGTGKTYTAKDIAEDIIFDGRVSDDKKDQQKKLEGSKRYKLIQFHPAYTYEDFVRGITVEANGSNVNYKAENRVLGAFAKEAAKPENKDKNYVLVIDEINRANLPAVLGELIYALEYRGHAVESMYKVDGGDNKLLLPDNLYIIGSMNTADRSVGHIDYAIRRRFAFKSILPQRPVIENHYEDYSTLKDKATKLFDEVSKLFIADNTNGAPKTEQLVRSAHMAQDFAPEDIWLGHSYFMVKKHKDGKAIDETEGLRQLDLKLQYEVKPLLREYVKDGILLEKSTIPKLDGSSNWTVKEYIEELKVS